jgi:xanthine/uracil/vitamin C permease (AzgA family)
VVTVIVWILDHNGPDPKHLAELPSFGQGIVNNLDFRVRDYPREMISAVVAFIFVGIFDISGVVFGMAELAKLDQPDGSIPGR